MLGWSGVLAAARRLAERGLGSDADEGELVRRTSLILYLVFVVAITPIWVTTYLILDRPLSAAIPLVYDLVSALSLAWYWRTARFSVVAVSQVASILALPVVLQWTLGGFVNGSAVILWSFTATMIGLAFFGRGAAALLFALFAATIVVSGFFEPILSVAVPPPPEGVRVGFFTLNVIAPLTAAMAVLLYVSRERELASARSEELLLNILPAAIAARLKRNEGQIADRHEEATVLFADIVGFTPFADQTSAEHVVELLDRAYSALDELVEQGGLEKIKTVGDAYMVAGGVPEPRPDHLEAVADLALAIRPALERELGEAWPDIQVRIGIDSGPVVAGVIGRRKLAYGVWGDTVNTASRMESQGLPGAIQVTERVYRRLGERYRFERRGEIEVKGKGPMTTYLLLGLQAPP